MRAQTLSLALASIALVGCSDTANDLSTQLPNALAGADQSVNEGTTVTLDGSASNSPSGNALSYSWQQVGASGVSLSGASSATATFVPEVSADTQLTFELSVTDSSGASASDQVLIAVNNAPTATISADAQSGLEGASIAISGAQSSDSDGGSIASYSWSQLEGTQATFSSTDSASTSITLPIISADSEELVFQLQVTDNDSATSTSSLTITVLNDATNPDLSAISVAEGSYGIGASATITITAANSETGLQLQSGSSFNGQPLTGFAEVVGTAGAYTATYTVASGDSDWSAGSTVDTGTSITLVDSAGNASATITEVALGANTSIDANAPTAKAGNNQTVNEAAEDLVQLDGTSSFDAYDGSIASYSWQQIDFIAAHAVELFTGGTNGDQASFAAPQDLVEDTTLTFQLSVTDSVGNSDTDTIEVLVNNAPTAVIAVLANEEPTNTTATGDAQQVNEGDAITLDGSGSSDSDNDTIAGYNWVQVADIDGNSLSSGALGLSGSDTVTATFTAPDDDADTTLYFQLTVTDDGGASSIAIVAIAINNNPTITMAADNPKEANEGEEVTFQGRGTDTNGGTIESYSWIETNGLVREDDITLTIKEGDGNFTAVFTAPNDLTEDTTLTFDINLTDDKGGIGTERVTLLVNNSPTANAGADAEYNETVGDAEVKVTLDGSASSDTNTSQGSSIADYSWREIKLDEDDNVVDVTGDDSVINDSYDQNITTISFTAPTVDQDTLLTFQLTVTDNDGAQDTDTIIVTINNSPTAEAGINQEVNESSDSAPIQVTLSGNESGDTDDGTITYLWEFVSSTDSQITSIDLTNANTATATFTAPKVEVNESNEGVTTLTFQLTVTDNDGATHSDLVEVAVHNLPVVESVYLIDGAYGIGDTATVYIRAGNQETGLELKDGSSFNGGQLADFTEIGDGLYSATYEVLESHASVANGEDVNVSGDLNTSITLVDAHDHESTTTTAVTLEGEYIDTVRPAIDFITIADGAYGIGDEMTLYIQVEGNEAGLVIKEGSDFSFNNVSLYTTDEGGAATPIFEDIGNGTYQTVYTVGSGGEDETDQADGAEVPIAITLTDPAGNDGTTYTPINDQDPPTITLQGESIDTTSPEISITSIGGDDNVTNSSEVDAAEIIGTTTEVEDGQTVTITVKDGANPSVSAEITTTVTNNSFSADINLSTLADGDITVTADVSDAAGNAADAATGTVEKDTEAPAQTIDSIALSADTGTSTTDFITNTATQTITATLSAVLGDDDILYGSVNSHDSGDVNWTDITNSISTENGKSISWTTTLTSGSIQFKVVDAAGNDGVVASQAYTLDTTIPSIDTLVVADGGDGVINSVEDDAVEISGTTSGAENGQTVNLTITNNNDASITTTTTATVSENGFSAANSNLDLSNLADGTYTVTADVSDIAGNPAIQASVAITVDKTAPSSITLDTVSEDNVINLAESASNVTLSGTTSGVEAGEKVTLKIDGTEVGTATVDSVNESGEGIFSVGVSLSGLADGDHILTADVSDVAGNAAPQAEVSVTLDTTAPSITALIVDDGGDGIINSAEAEAVPISGTTSGAETGQTISFAITDGTDTTTVSETASVNEDGAFSTTVNLSSLSLDDGDYKITADVSDVAGNTATQASISIKIDTTAPSINTLAVAEGDVINSDEISSVSISGTTSGAETGQTISFAITDGTDTTTVSETASVNEDGAFSTTVNLSSLSLDDGDYKITADVSDVAGNTATQASISIKIDTTAPSINTLAVAEGDVINSDEISSVSISGTTSGAETGQTISFAITDGTDTTTVSETASVNEDGAFSTTVNLSSLSLTDGDYTISANVSDKAGNAAPQTNVSVTIDTTAPVINTSGTSTTVDEAGNATLDASNSTDTGGTGIDKDSYSWVQVNSSSIDTAESVSSADANYVSLSNASNDIANFPAPGIASDSDTLTLYFKLTVTDIAGNSASSIATITINNTYQTPTVSASPV